jgi:hypothetical protein
MNIAAFIFGIRRLLISASARQIGVGGKKSRFCAVGSSAFDAHPTIGRRIADDQD